MSAALGVWLWHANRPLRQMRAAAADRRWADALRLALSYVAEHPDDAEALRIAGRSFLGLGQFKQADDCLARAGTPDTSDLRLRAEALVALDRPTEAVEVLSELRRRGDNGAQVLQRLAILQFRRGYLEEALGVVHELERDPDHEATAWFIQSTFHASLGHHEEAVACLERALELDPRGERMGQQPGTVFWYMGVALIDVARFDEAREWLRRAAAISESAEVYAYLGDAELGCGDEAAAERALHRALELDSQNIDSLVALGKLALEQNRPLEALEWLTLARRAGGNSPALHNALARANARVGHSGAAEEHLRIAGELRAEAGARRDDERLLAEYPHHLRSRLLLAHRAIDEGNLAEARALLDEALREHPDNQELRQLRALIEPQ